MKKHPILFGPAMLLILCPAILSAEIIPVYEVKPFLIDRVAAVQKMIGPYCSEQVVESEGRRVYRYTSVEGRRLIVDENGVVQLIINSEMMDITSKALSNRMTEMMNLIGAGMILQKPIRWEYRDEENRCFYRGKKLLDGLEVLNGDRIELTVTSVNNGFAEIALYFQWYDEQIIKNENPAGMQDRLNFNTNRLFEETNKIYFHKNGRYYLRVKDAGTGR